MPGGSLDSDSEDFFAGLSEKDVRAGIDGYQGLET
jgi:hypothetical protein